MTSHATGQLGENIAASYLEKAGYIILERNYRFERNEIDLICFDPASSFYSDGEIVFVEVKARHGHTFGSPAEAVTPEKQKRIARVAEVFLFERQLVGSPARFDVIAINLASHSPAIEHIKNAFIAP